MVIDLLVLIYAGSIMITMIIALTHQSYLISYNITTNESLRSRLPPETFDKGCYNNWSEVWNDA